MGHHAKTEPEPTQVWNSRPVRNNLGQVDAAMPMCNAKSFYRAARNGEVQDVRNYLSNAGYEHKRKALERAVEYGHFSVARVLIEEGGTRPSGRSLLTAVRYKMHSIVQLLLDHEVDRDYCESNGRTALMEAVMKVDESSISILLAAGASLDKMDCKRRNALFLALQGGMVDIASQLLRAGASARGCGGFLTRFILAGNEELVELLLRGGANPNMAYQNGSNYPLILATQHGRTRMVEVMVEVGVDVHQADKRGKTALNYATSDGRIEIARTLVRNGATASCKWMMRNAVKNGNAELVLLLARAASRSRTSDVILNDALMTATVCGSEELVRILLKNGANVNAVCGKGQTALNHALSRDYLSVAQALVQHGAEPMTCEPLMKSAIVAGDIQKIRLLLDCGANPDAIDDTGRPLTILTAVQSDQLEACRELGASGANVNYAPPGGLTPLMEAARVGDVEMVKTLLKLDADLNVQMAHGNTAVMWAAHYGYTEVIQLLIDAKANLEIVNDEGMTVVDCVGRNLSNYLPLWRLFTWHLENFDYVDVDASYFPIAATYYAEENVDMLQKLDRSLINKTIESDEALVQLCGSVDVKVNKRDRFNRSLLMYMAYRGHTGIVALLLSKGANINDVDTRGMTALTWATIGRHVDVVQVLISYGAIVNVPDRSQRTPLHYAVRVRDIIIAIVLANAGGKLRTRMQMEGALIWAAKEGHGFLVHELCQLKVDVNELDDYRATALIWAAEQGHMPCVMELLRWNPDINIVDSCGRTALWYALDRGHDEIVNCLLPGSGLKNINNGTPGLCAAARRGKVEHVRMMLERGVDVEWAEPDGTTALMCAAFSGSSEIVDLLLKKRADVQKANKDGETALHSATYADSPPVIDLLVAQKADIEKRNGNGLTPLLVASQLGKSDALDALLKHDADCMAVDDDGTTAVDLAIREGVDITEGAAAVAETLIAWGAEAADLEKTATAVLEYSQKKELEDR